MTTHEPKPLEPFELGHEHYGCHVVVVNENGLHARPASLVVSTANQFPCDVWIQNGQRRVDGKSIMELLSLAAEGGTKLTLEARGPKAVDALKALVELVNSGFGDLPTA